MNLREDLECARRQALSLLGVLRMPATNGQLAEAMRRTALRRTATALLGGTATALLGGTAIALLGRAAIALLSRTAASAAALLSATLAIALALATASRTAAGHCDQPGWMMAGGI